MLAAPTSGTRTPPSIRPRRRCVTLPLISLTSAIAYYADGRVSLFEKIKLKAAENRYNATVRGYR